MVLFLLLAVGGLIFFALLINSEKESVHDNRILKRDSFLDKRISKMQNEIKRIGWHIKDNPGELPKFYENSLIIAIYEAVRLGLLTKGDFLSIEKEITNFCREINKISELKITNEDQSRLQKQLGKNAAKYFEKQLEILKDKKEEYKYNKIKNQNNH